MCIYHRFISWLLIPHLIFVTPLVWMVIFSYDMQTSTCVKPFKCTSQQNRYPMTDSYCLLLCGGIICVHGYCCKSDKSWGLPKCHELTVWRGHTLENTTTFSSSEAAHLIHLLEQAIRCYHCGRPRFVIINACTCRTMGVLTWDDILSTWRHVTFTHTQPTDRRWHNQDVARSLNELTRACAHSIDSSFLSKGTHS